MSDRGHRDRVTRRGFLGAGVVTAASLGIQAEQPRPLPKELARLAEQMESYFTPQADFNDVSRGRPIPHSLPEAKKRQVGLTRESWKLEVVSDPDHPAKLGRELTIKDGSALDFKGLLKLAEKHAVRFPKIMTCLNIGCPLGMGIWEGVPLREVLWLTRPRENLRRVYYHGYHNDDPKQRFQSSLPIGRVLEDYFDLPPVILCYKLNGEWLEPERGGPVRVVVPEGYGFKCIKWLNRIVLTNLPHANDTYADGNNDVDSPLKTFAATLKVPAKVKKGEAIPITGHAQVGISGLSRVQVWISPAAKKWPAEDPYFQTAPWVDAHILPPPKKWGGGLPGEAIPRDTRGFEGQRPKVWPLPLSKAHWVALLPGLPAGEYILRCRSIDGKGQAQPLPRPFRKSGRCDIEAVTVTVSG